MEGRAGVWEGVWQPRARWCQLLSVRPHGLRSGWGPSTANAGPPCPFPLGTQPSRPGARAGASPATDGSGSNTGRTVMRLRSRARSRHISRADDRGDRSVTRDSAADGACVAVQLVGGHRWRPGTATQPLQEQTLRQPQWGGPQAPMRPGGHPSPPRRPRMPTAAPRAPQLRLRVLSLHLRRRPPPPSPPLCGQRPAGGE